MHVTLVVASERGQKKEEKLRGPSMQSLRASKVTSGRRSPSRGAFEGTTVCSNS